MRAGLLYIVGFPSFNHLVASSSSVVPTAAASSKYIFHRRASQLKDLSRPNSWPSCATFFLSFLPTILYVNHAWQAKADRSKNSGRPSVRNQRSRIDNPRANFKHPRKKTQGAHERHRAQMGTRRCNLMRRGRIVDQGQ